MYVVLFYWSESRPCVVCVCLGFWRRGVGVTKEWQDVLRLMSHCVAAATLFALYVTTEKKNSLMSSVFHQVDRLSTYSMLTPW